MIKNSLFIIYILVTGCILCNAQEAKLIPQWKTDSILPTPESVLIDKAENRLLVSMMGTGDRDEKDGNGAIGSLTMDGKPIDLDFVTGLHSPKGMGKYGAWLYVADLKELVKIDLQKRKIINKVNLDDVGMLNDVDVDDEGNVYISDSKGGAIYVFKNDIPTKLIDKLTNPNGVLVKGDTLYFVDSGSLFSSNKNDGGAINEIASGMEKSTDGIQLTEDGSFLISCWAGAIYLVKQDGTKVKLLDTQNEKKNTADFAYNQDEQLLYVPTFFKNTVEAYKLVH